MSITEHKALDIGNAIDEIIKEIRLATVKLNESCTPVPTRICLICNKLEHEAATAIISASAWLCPECKKKLKEIVGAPTQPPKTEEKPVRKYRVSWSVPTVKEQIIEAEDIEAAEDWWTHHFLFTGASLDRIELIDGKNADDDAEVC